MKHIVEDGVCVQSGLDPEFCGVCSGRDGGETAERSVREKRRARRIAAGCFIAQYAGLCSNCHESIAVGDPIKRDRDGTGWLGTCCP